MGRGQSAAQLQPSAQRAASASSFCLRDIRRQPVMAPVAVRLRLEPGDEGRQGREQAGFSITHTPHPFPEQE